jgi:rubredoxin
MSKRKELYRVLNKGGVLSPSLFLDILQVAEEAGNGHVFLGSRQDILFYLPTGFDTSNFNQVELPVHKRSSGIQNLVSSYVCVDILPSTNWMYSGIYLKIIEQFSTHHRLRVNIVDPFQNMVPLFYGHLNFIASEMPNYWYLCLNLIEGKDPQIWPGLIFTDDIAAFAQTLEQLIVNRKLLSTEKLVQGLANSHLQKNTLEISKNLDVPTGFSPCYEGLNRMDGKDTYWAGFYWRNNHYPVQFLKEVCQLCRQTNIGKISFTPWKTFLIKDIQLEDKILWEELIGRHGINMRHSSFELNWHIPLLNKEAFRLKRFLMTKFDKFDICTTGLSFAIQNNPGEQFTSVVIRPKGRFPFLGKFDFTKTYNIEYAYDFNPNSNHYLEYATNLDKYELPEKLNEISKRYYARFFAQGPTHRFSKHEKQKNKYKRVHQCPDCLTVYDETYGDLLAGIKAGILFSELGENYECPVCQTPKAAFYETEITEPAS